jgi:hypothetical protein
MPNPTIESLLSRIGDPDLIKKVRSLPSSEFNSLFLEIMRQQAADISPSDLMKAYAQNRFVTPSSIDPIAFLTAELELLDLAKASEFGPLELSPLAPLGNCSAIGLVDQNKIVSALRGTEVVADATNLLALESIVRRKSVGFDSSVVHLCAIHRHVRAQALPEGKGFTPHFKIFCAVSAGADRGSLAFEKQTILTHLELYKKYLANTLDMKKVSITIKGLVRENEQPTTSRALYNHVAQNLRGIDIHFTEVPLDKHRYYQHTRFSLDVNHNGQVLNMGDGGFVDWGQKLASNSKERMLTSGIGLELLIKFKAGTL